MVTDRETDTNRKTNRESIKVLPMITEKTDAGLGLVIHWRPYLWGRHFTCCTDHLALTHLYQTQDTSNLLTRWAIALKNYDFTVQHVPGRLNVVPEALSKTRLI